MIVKLLYYSVGYSHGLSSTWMLQHSSQRAMLQMLIKTQSLATFRTSFKSLKDIIQIIKSLKNKKLHHQVTDSLVGCLFIERCTKNEVSLPDAGMHRYIGMWTVRTLQPLYRPNLPHWAETYNSLILRHTSRLWNFLIKMCAIMYTITYV